MTKEQRQDEMVLAKIIAGAKASGRQVRRNTFGVMPGDADDGPCCAIGAGCLYAGVTRVPLDERPDSNGVSRSLYGPIAAFAVGHGVSEGYAAGVSDGFENLCDLYTKKLVSFSYGACNPGLVGPDYWRGFGVGNAAYDALVAPALAEGQGEP